MPRRMRQRARVSSGSCSSRAETAYRSAASRSASTRTTGSRTARPSGRRSPTSTSTCRRRPRPSPAREPSHWPPRAEGAWTPKRVDLNPGLCHRDAAAAAGDPDAGPPLEPDPARTIHAVDFGNDAAPTPSVRSPASWRWTGRISAPRCPRKTTSGRSARRRGGRNASASAIATAASHWGERRCGSDGKPRPQ